MVKIEHPETYEYRQSIRSIEELEIEQKHINLLPEKLRPLAEYLYSSEIKMLARRKVSLENEALQVLAKHLVILSESLKFLKFEVIREKYNPDNVSSPKKNRRKRHWSIIQMSNRFDCTGLSGATTGGTNECFIEES